MAMDVINGERQDQYGNPEDSFRLIGDLWGRYLQEVICNDDWPTPESELLSISPEHVAMMMVLFKIARETHQVKHDNVVDAAGYLGIYSDIVSNKSTSLPAVCLMPSKQSNSRPLDIPTKP